MKSSQKHDLSEPRTTGKSSPKVRAGLVINVLLVLSGLFASPLVGQENPSVVNTGLSVSEEGEVSTFWGVLKAGLREELAGTTGYVEIKNISNTLIEDPIFYGEYYDSSGRFCFSLILSQDTNPGKQGAIAPGESDIVSSTGVGLFPMWQPKEVRLFLVRLGLPERQQIRKWDVPIRAPITLLGGFDRDLRIPSEAASGKMGIVDLILAKVAVDKEGIVTSVEIIHAAGGQVESWFRDFLKQATFYPATNRDQPQDGRALLLVRAVTGEGNFRELVPPPQLSPWVSSYAESGQDNTTSLVTNILLGRPATRKNRLTATGELVTVGSPPSPPGLFQMAYQDTYWSSPVVQLVRDDSMPHHMRREVGNSPAALRPSQP